MTIELKSIKGVTLGWRNAVHNADGSTSYTLYIRNAANGDTADIPGVAVVQRPDTKADGDGAVRKFHYKSSGDYGIAVGDNGNRKSGKAERMETLQAAQVKMLDASGVDTIRKVLASGVGKRGVSSDTII